MVFKLNTSNKFSDHFDIISYTGMETFFQNQVVETLKGKYFGITIDETTDVDITASLGDDSFLGYHNRKNCFKAIKYGSM